MPQRIKMAITTHTTMIVTTFDESFFLFSAAEVEFDTFAVEDVVNMGTYNGLEDEIFSSFCFVLKLSCKLRTLKAPNKNRDHNFLNSGKTLSSNHTATRTQMAE